MQFKRNMDHYGCDDLFCYGCANSHGKLLKNAKNASKTFRLHIGYLNHQSH